MKFLSVTLTNILAYEGQVVVDLSKTDVEHNLVLIWGRNGKGKTSFINALKYLFAGIDDPNRRRVGFPPRVLPPGQFVRGDGDHWMGIINRHAARIAARDRTSVTASVAAVWQDGEVQVSARREWVTGAEGTYRETLVVTDGRDRLAGPAAEDRLREFIPSEYVNFFFFDGEDIKSLAETAERKNIDFDKLLRLTFVGELQKAIVEAATDRRRKTMDQKDRTKLRRIERELREAMDAIVDADRVLVSTEDLLVTKTYDLRRAQGIRENLAGGASEAQREALESRLGTLTTSLSEALSTILSTVPPEIPVVANLGLVEIALRELDARLEGAGATERILLRRIAAELPGWVASADVELDQSEQEKLVAYLLAHLNKLAPENEQNGLFADLDPARADRVRTALLRHAGGGNDKRAAQVALLMSAHRDYVEHAAIREELLRLEVGSQANLDRYRQVVDQIAGLEDEIASLNQKKGVELDKKKVAEADQVSLERDRKRLLDLQTRADKDESEARFIDRLSRALQELQERLRRAAREDVTRRLNIHFKNLVYEHPLVDQIRIDEDYTMSFYDAGGGQVGRASLSSGLKQLAATALLWAMKDSADYDFPVVIDTPLGRIDRENQDMMLTNYYPHLSEQVIVLPTNAEIDKRKHGLIENRIAQEYIIDNESGESATIKVGSFVRH